jgi:hypothetical protein
MLEDQDLVPVATFDTLSEAEIAVGLLEAEGIDAVLQDRPLASLLPPVAFANGGLALLVAPEQLAEAKEILAQPDRMGPGENGEAAALPPLPGDAAT